MLLKNKHQVGIRFAGGKALLMIIVNDNDYNDNDNDDKKAIVLGQNL